MTGAESCGYVVEKETSQNKVNIAKTFFKIRMKMKYVSLSGFQPITLTFGTLYCVVDLICTSTFVHRSILSKPQFNLERHQTDSQGLVPQSLQCCHDHVLQFTDVHSAGFLLGPLGIWLNPSFPQF